MKTARIVMTVGCLASVFALVRSAAALDSELGELRDWLAARQARVLSWHDCYYDPAWGMPTALVVPPTVCRQTNYSWGAAGTRISRVPYQFRGTPVLPTAYDVHAYCPTPPWPSRTEQSGDYYVRGPRECCCKRVCP
ncbi:MAG: hypothetical protein ABSG86_11115 [Thermoguttaceae bacterium]|jgi:hypothetical protein